MSHQGDPKAILREGVEKFEEKLKTTPEEIEKVHGPFWNARYELAKNIVSLSSAALVLTVTFSKSLVEAKPPAVPVSLGGWRYLLFGSWLAFLLCLIFATLSLWISIKLKTVGARLFNQRAKIEHALGNLDLNDPDPLSELKELLAQALDPLEPAEVWQGRSLDASLIMFVVALALLGAFGWKQFASLP